VSDDFKREACFWTSTSPGYNTRDRQRTFMKDGKKVTEKFPQRGHAGDYEDRRRADGTRYVRLIDHHGHEIFHTLTNAAAHLDHTAPFGQYMMGKARAFGWFMPGHCPCALLATGELSTDHIVSGDVRKGTACQPGSYSYENQCQHSKAERAARMGITAKSHEDREAKMKGNSEKHLEATHAMTAKVAEAVEAMLESRTTPKAKDKA
jgi:hypothetical protein